MANNKREDPTKYVHTIIRIILMIVFLCASKVTEGQVRIRLFSEKYPTTTLFTVSKGSFTLESYKGDVSILKEGDYVVITLSDGKLGIKNGSSPAYRSDSLSLTSVGEQSRFNLRINGKSPERRYYSGDLTCRPDMGTMVFINNVDPEEYVAGVVRAEGGPGKHQEYLKTQAILARTYLYKYIDKHIIDGYNLCDGTHCQVYQGITDDESILTAVNSTKGMVIIDADSLPILAAFHSNCGGETARPEDVWLTSLPYLTSKTDPYCTSSNNSTWETSLPLDTWISYLRDKGYSGKSNNELNFIQTDRQTKYTAGDFSFPLTTIRNDLRLRSTFFSVEVSGDKVILSGKGYGHGVGLCQEGAMVMAINGYTYEDIIEFYYSGVKIATQFKTTPKEK